MLSCIPRITLTYTCDTITRLVITPTIKCTIRTICSGITFFKTSSCNKNIPLRVFWCLMPLSTLFLLYLLLVEETGVSGENNRPATSHRQTLSHNIVSSTPDNEQDSNSQLGSPVSSTDKTDCHDITEILFESGLKHPKPNLLFEQSNYIKFCYIRSLTEI